MSGRGGARRRATALLLCPLLGLHACSAGNPVRPGTVLSRSVIDDAVEVKADPDTEQHLLMPPEIARLREARVVLLGLAVRNISGNLVIVHTAASHLELEDGRVLRVIHATDVDERRPKTDEPSADTPASDGGGDDGYRYLSALFPGLLVGIVLVITSPIWGPPFLIAHLVKQNAEKQQLRSAAFESLDNVPLAKGETAGGLLYFAPDGELPETLAVATLVVAVHRLDTAREETVRLRLGPRG